MSKQGLNGFRQSVGVFSQNRGEIRHCVMTEKTGAYKGLWRFLPIMACEVQHSIELAAAKGGFVNVVLVSFFCVTKKNLVRRKVDFQKAKTP
jgi:hypothetical protein